MEGVKRPDLNRGIVSRSDIIRHNLRADQPEELGGDDGER